MDILLARHGNTFAPGDKIVWAGRKQDLPLVEKGVQQAEDLARVLQQLRIRPQAVFCSPLKRTQRYAEIIIEQNQLKLEAAVDDRLNEIDYGEWGGLSSDEVSARFGQAEQQAWNSCSKWPVQAKWGSRRSELEAAVNSFAEDLALHCAADSTVLVVTSNGVLRFFLGLIAGEMEKRFIDGSFKVKTGNICKIVNRQRTYSVSFWNSQPKDLIEV